jgi:hypothetical protein
LRRLLPHLRLLSLTPLETTELPPNFLTTDEKLAVLEANVKKLQTRAALNKFPKHLSSETNTRSAVIHNQPLIVTFLSSSDKRDLIRISSREHISFSNTLLVVPKDNVNLVKVNFLGCHAKADRNLTEKTLFNVTVAVDVDGNAQKCNFEVFLYKGEKGRLILRKPTFLPKNKETKISLTISWVGTAYFLNQKVSSTIDCSSVFKKLSFGKNSDVVFFDSFGYVRA